LQRAAADAILSHQHTAWSAAVPPVTGILETALYVSDVARSRQFYEGLFGFRTIAEGARLSALAVRAGQVLLLFRKQASAGLGNTAHDGDGQLHLAFAVPAAELAAWEAQLAERDIAIVERKTWDLGGHSLYFRDPDGHLVELATPGVWTNY
jgi:catechol 2,3-dioxygenase-like lactoylglutathione lyase family enzyme